jgi:hypothetical protein
MLLPLLPPCLVGRAYRTARRTASVLAQFTQMHAFSANRIKLSRCAIYGPGKRTFHMLLNTFVENGHSPKMCFDFVKKTSELEPTNAKKPRLRLDSRRDIDD